MSITDEERRTAQEVYILPRDDEQMIYEKSDEEIEFDKFRDELKDGLQYSKINVYRQPTTGWGKPGGKKLAFLFECGFDEFSYSQLCSKLLEEYGSGTYRMQARDAQNRLRLNRAITVEAPKKELTVSSGQNDFTGILREMRESMASQMEMMREMMGPSSPVSDPIDQMTKMMAAMGAMMGAMGMNPQPQKTLVEQLTEFKMIKELFGDSDSDGGSDDNIYSLLKATVTNAGPLLAALATTAAKAPTAVPEKQPQMIEQKPVNEKANELKPFLDILLMQARVGADPEKVADIALEKIPDEKLEDVEVLLSEDDCIDKLQSMANDIKKYREWFERWRAAMLNGLAQILDDDPDNESPERERVTKDLTNAENKENNSSDSDAGHGGNERIADITDSPASGDT